MTDSSRKRGKSPLRRLLSRPMRLLRYAGWRLHCPLCGGRFRKFLPWGQGEGRRPDARCPGCGSLERERHLYLFLQEHLRTELEGRPEPFRLLHVAPEAVLGPLLARRPGIEYLSADLESPRVMRRMNLTAIDLPDGSFDGVLCSHVLEHIPDDRRAMREIRRVLTPGGWALLLVPLQPSRETTLEDPSVVSREDRREQFGQHDHVRIYGKDFADRLREAGFLVRPYSYARERGPAAARRYGLDLREDLFVCTRPAE